MYRKQDGKCEHCAGELSIENEEFDHVRWHDARSGKAVKLMGGSWRLRGPYWRLIGGSAEHVFRKMLGVALPFPP